MIPTADNTQPMPNATSGSILRDGSGRSAVRFIRASRSTSISWLKAAEPNAAAAVPRMVWSSFIQFISTPREYNRNPKNVVTSTKKFSRTFIKTIKSCRNPGGGGIGSAAAAFSFVADSSSGAAEL